MYRQLKAIGGCVRIEEIWKLNPSIQLYMAQSEGIRDTWYHIENFIGLVTTGFIIPGEHIT